MYYLTSFESEMQYRNSSLRMFLRMAALKNSECPRKESAADTCFSKATCERPSIFHKSFIDKHL